MTPPWFLLDPHNSGALGTYASTYVVRKGKLLFHAHTIGCIFYVCPLDDRPILQKRRRAHTERTIWGVRQRLRIYRLIN